MTTNSKKICGVIPRFQPTMEPFDLPSVDGWPAQRHQFEENTVWAVQAALAACRPLLVRGEPGTGKSQLARAAAHAMNRPFIYQVITSQTEVTDLLYELDSVSRLAEAQILGAMGGDREEVRRQLSPERFISPGKIWWSTDWRSARKQAQTAGSYDPGYTEEEWDRGAVLLIDEIDKADAELPNALLECFANQSFQVPYLKTAVSRNSRQAPPLVVVTTNEERELPAAFLRRCMVLHLSLAKDRDKLAAFLIRRGQVHFENDYGQAPGFKDVLRNAADMLIDDRDKAASSGLHKPGQAEYLDLCRAVFEISQERDRPVSEVLKAVADFALRKNPV